MVVHGTSHEGPETSAARGRTSGPILCGIGAALVVVSGFTFVATAGQGWLPAIMQGNHYTSAMIGVVSGVWGLSLLALIALWRQRPYSVLDLWLMVVMCAWLFDIALAAVLNHGRFDLGFYAGRIYGFLAASFVLMVLLVENGKLYFALDRQNRSLEATVRERTERLLQSEKIATMGSLLAGVAHELNNPLAVVLGQSHLLRESAADRETAARAEKIVTGADRCVRIVRNFLAMARQQAPERSQVGLNELVQDSVELVAYELRTDNVEIVLDLAADLPILWADRHQLQQVLINLVTNAHHALRKSPAAERMISIITRSDRARARVHLEIADTGQGIPAEIRARIFEPFFTTKEKGKGTGLGLSTVFGIAEQSGGGVWVYSELGKGTTFKVYLPATDEAPEAALPKVQIVTLRGTETVLLVEDEDQIRNVARGILERHGYRVIECRNAGEALLTCEQHKGTIHLLLSDVVMPQMSGKQLAVRLAPVRPEMKVLFMSGYTDGALVGQLATGSAFLQKPLTPGALTRKVREVLDSPGQHQTQ